MKKEIKLIAFLIAIMSICTMGCIFDPPVVTDTVNSNPARWCGDGVLDHSQDEECDDGINNNDYLPGTCRQDCTLPSCGDLVVDPGEVCDDGNHVSGDGCSGKCLSDETCGNSLVDVGEECDDGNTEENDWCRTNCVLPRCGDSIVDSWETCDDGNHTSGDGCSFTCHVQYGWECYSFPSVCVTICGDGYVVGAEECDDIHLRGQSCKGLGFDAGKLTCNPECTYNTTECNTFFCGDGTIDATEQCDDGNVHNCDGCDSNCRIESTPLILEAGAAIQPMFTCGDGNLECGEQCDDGNNVGGDGCSATCVIEYCGSGILDIGEECDDSNLDDCDGCDSNCAIEQVSCFEPIELPPPSCGDGTLDSGEACDDGNVDDCDGCSSTCVVEYGCGDGSQCLVEACDDGNHVSNDGCSATCILETSIFWLIYVDTAETPQATVAWRIRNSVMSYGYTLIVGEDVYPADAEAQIMADMLMYDIQIDGLEIYINNTVVPAKVASEMDPISIDVREVAKVYLGNIYVVFN